MEINEGSFIVTDELEIHPIALIMPPMNDVEFNEFKIDISGQGLLEPIVLFQGKVLDGRNRYNACRDLGIDVWAKQWEGGMDPVDYVVSKNIHRRQLTVGQRAMAASKALDFYAAEARERQKEAGSANLAKHHADNGHKIEAFQSTIGVEELVVAPVQQLIEPAFERKAISQAGKTFNVSGRSVAAAKYVTDHGTEEEVKAVETGNAPLKAVEKVVRERVKTITKPANKATFNATTDSIEWAKWTWNPVTGCKHGCQYCYARDIAKRYPDGFPHGFEPTFLPERLDAPLNTKLPASRTNGNRNVFVCSMADLFGSWVPDEWINEVLSACEQTPDWNFIFLTKNPSRLVGIEFPVNAWVGTTVDCQERVEAAVKAFREMDGSDIRPTVCFLSCEPMVERLDFGEEGLIPFDWVIIGGRSSSSGMPAAQPDWEWLEKLHYDARAAGCKVYWKPNLKVRPTEYPVTE